MDNELILARKVAGHSQAEAAHHIGCGISTIYKLETKGILPQQRILVKGIKQYITDNLEGEINESGQ